jgi:RNA polymerase sigma-70 factor (ECF subfamily)
LKRSTARADAFIALLRPLQGLLEVYCRRILRNPSQVEDVLQDAVAAAFARFDRYAEGTNFKAWIFRFVTLEVFNRNRKHEPIAFSDLPSDLSAEDSWDFVTCEETFAAILDDPDVLLEHFNDVLAEALQNLPAPERAVLLLRAIGEFSYDEIHDVLSIPLGSVMGYLSRARKRLRLSLADYAAERGLYRHGPLAGESSP